MTVRYSLYLKIFELWLEPVDFGRVNVAFMKSSYEICRQVNTFMGE